MTLDARGNGEEIFAFRSDWLNHFEDHLQKINLDNKDRWIKKTSSVCIKTLIVESNQDLMQLVNHVNKDGRYRINIIRSKDKEFYNSEITVRRNGVKYLSYIDTENPRFWLIHYKCPQNESGSIYSSVFTKQLYQDSICLSKHQMIKLDIDYRETDETFNYKGKCSVSRGINLFKHIERIKRIREDYNNKVIMIESYRNDESPFLKTDLFRMEFSRLVNRKRIIKKIHDLQSEFKLYFVALYNEDKYDYYKIVDLHTAQRLYMQVFNDKILINLPRNGCGNSILRFKERFIRKFDDKLELSIAGQKIN